MRSLLTLTTSLLAVAALAAGCQTNVRFNDDGHGDECGPPPPPSDGWCPPSWACVDGQWVDTAGDCPSVCPAERPTEGSACQPTGQWCSYEEWAPGNCGPDDWYQVDVVCTVEGWSTMSSYCQPEPVCPVELPVAGSDCSDWWEAYFCDWQVETPCGSQWVSGYCDGTTWIVDPAQACGNCGQNADAASCSIDPSCQWLEPGCGEPPLPSAGCFPADGCDSGCGASEVCATVVVDPCWNDLCDACGMEADVCLPGT